MNRQVIALTIALSAMFSLGALTQNTFAQNLKMKDVLSAAGIRPAGTAKTPKAHAQATGAQTNSTDSRSQLEPGMLVFLNELVEDDPKSTGDTVLGEAKIKANRR